MRWRKKDEGANPTKEGAEGQDSVPKHFVIQRVGDIVDSITGEKLGDLSLGPIYVEKEPLHAIDPLTPGELIWPPQGISSPKPIDPSQPYSKGISRQAPITLGLLGAQIIQKIETELLALLGEEFENAEYPPWERNQLMTEALVKNAKTSFVYTCILLAENARQAYYSQTGHETLDNYFDHLELDRSQKSRYLCIGNAILNGVIKLDDALDIPKSNLNLITPLLRNNTITPKQIEQAKKLDFNGMRKFLGHEVRKPEGEYITCPRCGEIFLKAEAKKVKEKRE